jgi:hypothetical protein
MHFLPTACAVCLLPTLALFAQAHAPHDVGALDGPVHAGDAGNELEHEDASNDFNPAIGGVLDLLFDYADLDSPGGDGFDLQLRTLDLTANGWIGPNAWTYAVIAADADDIALEEAAVHYLGLGKNSGLRAGRFFVDFGQQMRVHVHDLATITRPAVLRSYLGEELAGTGLQYSDAVDIGDAAEAGSVRFSFALFDSLLAEHAHDDEPSGAPEIEAHVDERQQLDELAFTARVAGQTTVGESGMLEFGASWRAIPDYAIAYEPSGARIEDLSNDVYGLDITLGTRTEQGHAGWTCGAEYLLFDGDLGGALSDPGNTPGDPTDDVLSVFQDDVSGYYIWVERGLDASSSVGALYSSLERPEPGRPEESELQVYYTRHLSEFARLRFGVTAFESEAEVDSQALLVQFTSFVGTHAHGLSH